LNFLLINSKTSAPLEFPSHNLWDIRFSWISFSYISRIRGTRWLSG